MPRVKATGSNAHALAWWVPRVLALREAALNSARPEAGVAPEIRTNPDGSLDEVVAENCSFHLEQMDVDHWWMAVEAGGKRVAVWLHGRGKIKASWEQEARATSPLPQQSAFPDDPPWPQNCPECGHGNRLNGRIIHAYKCSRTTRGSLDVATKPQ